MKVLERRNVIITYCDYCKKELTPPYHTIELKSGLKFDLCSTVENTDDKTCKDKYLNEILMPKLNKFSDTIKTYSK